MSFPQRNWLGFPKGWADRGQVSGVYDGNKTEFFSTCNRCRTTARIGKDPEPFLFCPKCEVKLNPPKK